jgi:hypothetical protein
VFGTSAMDSRRTTAVSAYSELNTELNGTWAQDPLWKAAPIIVAFPDSPPGGYIDLADTQLDSHHVYAFANKFDSTPTGGDLAKIEAMEVRAGGRYLPLSIGIPSTLTRDVASTITHTWRNDGVATDHLVIVLYFEGARSFTQTIVEQVFTNYPYSQQFEPGVEYEMSQEIIVNPEITPGTYTVWVYVDNSKTLLPLENGVQKNVVIYTSGGNYSFGMNECYEVRTVTIV